MNELTAFPARRASGDLSPAGATIEVYVPQRGRRSRVKALLAFGVVCVMAAGGVGAYATHEASQRMARQAAAQETQKAAAVRDDTRRQIGALQDQVHNLQSKVAASEKRNQLDRAQARSSLAALERKVAVVAVDTTPATRPPPSTTDKPAALAKRNASAEIDRTPVGSIAKQPTPARADVRDGRGAVGLPGFTLLQAEDGAAVVDFRGFRTRVAPGDLLAGAGRVIAVRRRGDGWVVVTDRGEIVGAPRNGIARVNPL